MGGSAYGLVNEEDADEVKIFSTDIFLFLQNKLKKNVIPLIPIVLDGFNSLII